MKKKCFVFFLASFLVLWASFSMDPTAVAAKEKKSITIAAGRPGDVWYVLSHALATFINERSDKLKADVVTTAGVTDNTRLIMGKTEFRATHINVTMIPGHNVWGKGEYFPLKIGSLVHLASVWITFDPKIKTFTDLKGKAVAVPRKVEKGYTWIFVDQLKQAGVWESVKPMHGGLSALVTALRDGAAHAGVMMFDFVYPNEFRLGSYLEELKARATLHFIQQGNVDANIAMIAKACRSEEFAALNLPTLALVVPAKAMGPTQTEAMAVVSCPVYWSAGKEMPNDVVYEITKILYEAAKKGEFAPYHTMGKGVTPDFLTTSFWETEKLCQDNFHPGALKFYDDVKIRLKSFGEEYAKYRK
ncbi:MAG: TAXI family TRAP transporter solute-binding subunit [Thermodesulfobacteriota bacterium]|nr:TAXI family TRAP transporter solute-binding subunit [Thermodesulfobacteriota bacterium]